MTKGALQTKTRTGLVAALDIGSTKMCCLIARVHGGEGVEVVGIGHQVSKGVRAGAIVNLEAAEASIRATVEAAEQMAGDNIRHVNVNLSGGDYRSRLIAYEVALSGHEIGDGDIRRILEASARECDMPPEHDVIHTVPVGYSIDGHKGVRDPRGMFGDRLGVNLHLVSASTGAVRNLKAGVERCHLGIENMLVGPYASALSVVSADERDLGVCVIDMGGGTTTIAVFFDGELVHVESIPVGGASVTNDIARGLATPIVHAERMKTLYGSAIASPSDDHEIIKAPLIGEEENVEINQVPRSMLVGIIRPRIEETFELVRDRLGAAGFDKLAGRTVVLTGGGCQLPGVQEMAGEILQKQIRIGRPRTLPGLAEMVSGPAFATAVGLLSYAASSSQDVAGRAYRPCEESDGRWSRLGRWIKENF
ncbi:cell division protein FtsA [Varunaivibrio sulfuroxidans]|nr:cell division protein FtsA [Varunaivibrio sulfuroxidans]WES30626.1 cell division protein FtsA [Varunaivibrio sulfuroxidans]